MSVKKSAGLVIIQNNKILLVHPTGASWWNSYSIPKGKIEDDENPLDAAIRETKEEIGIEIKREWIVADFQPNPIDYKNVKGRTYKKVFWYLVDLDKIGIDIEISKDKLQEDEVDWVGFLTLEEAKKRIFTRFEPILQALDLIFKMERLCEK